MWRFLSCARLALAGVLVTSALALVTPGVQATTNSNTVTLFLRAGDARSVATCLNIARQNHGNNTQVNSCRNVARAQGGDIVLLDTTIAALQTSDATVGNPSQSNLAVTATGGNATSIATCVNATASTGSRNRALNHCTNIAVSVGGSVVLINVNVTGVQLT